MLPLLLMSLGPGHCNAILCKQPKARTNRKYKIMQTDTFVQMKIYVIMLLLMSLGHMQSCANNQTNEIHRTERNTNEEIKTSSILQSQTLVLLMRWCNAILFNEVHCRTNTKCK